MHNYMQNHLMRGTLMIKAKEILKNKFWLVENDGQKLGTISTTEDQFVYSCHTGSQFFPKIENFKKIVGAEVVWSNADSVAKTTDLEVHGYPTSSEPFNSVLDVKNKLPLFTKSDKSKSLYCAGYYIIRFNKGWVKSFCPKLVTLERYDFKGPFKTEIEMRTELSNANKRN